MSNSANNQAKVQEIRNKRGFELASRLNTIGIVLVKADAERVSQHLAYVHSGTSRKIARIQDFNFAKYWNAELVVQFKGHPYSIFCYSPKPFRNIASDISKDLKTDCLCYETEDCSGWSGYKFYWDGSCLESYEYGSDYEDEFCGDDPKLLQKWRQKRETKNDTWVVDRGCESLFSSRIQTATKEELLNPLEFMDSFFKSQNAWLPNSRFFSPSYMSEDIAKFDLGDVNCDEVLDVHLLTGMAEYKHSLGFETHV